MNHRIEEPSGALEGFGCHKVLGWPKLDSSRLSMCVRIYLVFNLLGRFWSLASKFCSDHQSLGSTRRFGRSRASS